MTQSPDPNKPAATATPAPGSAPHVAKVLGAAHPRATVNKPRGFAVLHETTSAPGFQVLTIDEKVCVAHRIPGDDNPSPEVAAAMLLALTEYKPTLKAQGFHGENARMDRTGYPYLRITGRTVQPKAPAPAADVLPPVSPA